jgi:hypothetical protein
VHSGSNRSALYKYSTPSHIDYDWMIGLIYTRLSKREEHLAQKTRLYSSESIACKNGRLRCYVLLLS